MPQRNPKPISSTVWCEHCQHENDVMFYPSDAGQPDPNQSNACPPTPAYHDPSECGACGAELLVEVDGDEMNQEQYEAMADYKRDEERDRRMEESN